MGTSIDISWDCCVCKKCVVIAIKSIKSIVDPHGEVTMGDSVQILMRPLRRARVNQADVDFSPLCIL